MQTIAEINANLEPMREIGRQGKEGIRQTMHRTMREITVLTADGVVRIVQPPESSELVGNDNPPEDGVVEIPYEQLGLVIDWLTEAKDELEQAGRDPDA